MTKACQIEKFTNVAKKTLQISLGALLLAEYEQPVPPVKQVKISRCAYCLQTFYFCQTLVFLLVISGQAGAQCQ